MTSKQVFIVTQWDDGSISISDFMTEDQGKAQLAFLRSQSTTPYPHHSLRYDPN